MQVKLSINNSVLKITLILFIVFSKYINYLFIIYYSYSGCSLYTPYIMTK